MRPSTRALAVLGLSSALACTADRAPSAPAAAGAAAVVSPASSEQDAQTVQLRRKLERAADGLLYTSESDYPFEFFFLPAQLAAPLDVGSFRALLGVPPDETVEERSLDDFFARHIERADPNDPVAQALVPRYRHLRETIRKSVRDARVFRVGTIVIRCYIVGTDDAGNIVGLTTTAIET